MLILHGELGVPDWLQAHELLAQRYSVYVPSLPGFGSSSFPDWIMSVRDLSAWVSWFVRDYGLSTPLNVIGFSLGGWIAAELATANSAIFSKMVLVGAAGIKPREGEIWDYFLHSAKEAFQQSFHDTESPEYLKYYARTGTPDEADQGRDQPGGGHPLPLASLHAQHHVAGPPPGHSDPYPARMGEAGRHRPHQQLRALPAGIHGAQAAVFEDCGHMPEMEKPDEFTKTVLEFLGG